MSAEHTHTQASQPSQWDTHKMELFVERTEVEHVKTGTCTVKHSSGSEPLCALTMAHSGKSVSGVGNKQAHTQECAGVDDDPTIAQILSQLLAGQLRLERDLLSLREAQTQTHTAVIGIRTRVESNSSLVEESNPMGQNLVFCRSSLRPEVEDGDGSNVEPGGSQTDAERQVGPKVPDKELLPCAETLSDVSGDSLQLTQMFETETGVSQDETERGVGEARWPSNVVRREMSNATCGTVVEATLTDGDELDKRISRGLHGRGIWIPQSQVREDVTNDSSIHVPSSHPPAFQISLAAGLR